jgi:hypothetical protein
VTTPARVLRAARVNIRCEENDGSPFPPWPPTKIPWGGGYMFAANGIGTVENYSPLPTCGLLWVAARSPRLTQD